MPNQAFHNLEQEKIVKYPQTSTEGNQAERQTEQINLQTPEVGNFAGSLDNFEGVEGPELKEQSEGIGENKGIGLGKKAASTHSQALTQEQIKAKLLANCPAEKVMKNQVGNTIHQQLHTLEKQFKQASKNISQAFQLNNIVAKMRELKDILAILAHATYEMIRSLWLKIVHNIQA